MYKGKKLKSNESGQKIYKEFLGTIFATLLQSSLVLLLYSSFTSPIKFFYISTDYIRYLGRMSGT